MTDTTLNKVFIDTAEATAKRVVNEIQKTTTKKNTEAA